MATPELVEMTMQTLAALKEDLDHLRGETQQSFDRLNARLDEVRDAFTRCITFSASRILMRCKAW